MKLLPEAGRGHHRVPAGEDGLDGRVLVGVETVDAKGPQELPQFRGQQVGRGLLRGRGRNNPMGDHLRPEPARPLERGHVLRHRAAGVGGVFRAVH